VHRLIAGDPIADVLEPYAHVDRRSGDGPCWVLANMVGGLDGSAAFAGRVGPLSAGADAQLFRLLRAVADVVLVGAETVRRERYGPVRLPDALREARRAEGRPPTPPLAVVSRSLALDWEVGAFAEPDPAAPPLVITCGAADPERVAEARRHAEVLVADGELVDVREALAALAARGHRVVLCEGGPTLLGELVDAGLLDELCLTLAPIMGGDALPVSVSPSLGRVTEFALAHAAADGDTLFLRYERRGHGR
jgi:riboflavin biosynthesis pyrimidine reductase